MRNPMAVLDRVRGQLPRKVLRALKRAGVPLRVLGKWFIGLRVQHQGPCSTLDLTNDGARVELLLLIEEDDER